LLPNRVQVWFASALIAQASGSPIAVLNHNKPAAYLIPAETYEALLEMIEDYELARVVEAPSDNFDVI